MDAVRKLLYPLELRLPIIELNGCLVTDFISGEHLCVNGLLEEHIARLLEDFRRFHLAPFMAACPEGRDALYYSDLRNLAMEWYAAEKVTSRDPRLVHLTQFGDYFRSETVLGFVLLDRREVLAAFVDHLLEQYGSLLDLTLFEHPYLPGWWELSVQSPGISKGSAVDQLLSLVNLNDARVVAFGDGMNDAALFKRAHHALAVRNADPLLLNLAHEIIATNDEDGVVGYLLKNFTGGQ